MAGTVLPFSLVGTGSGVLQSVTIAGSEHVIRAEGHPAFGGTDSAPSPLDLALGSLVSCTQVTGQIIAAGSEGAIELGRWNVELTSHLDNSVLVHGEEGISNFRDVTLDVTVHTNLDDEAFAEFAAEVERRCPIAQLFRGSGVQLSTSWTNEALEQA